MPTMLSRWRGMLPLMVLGVVALVLEVLAARVNLPAGIPTPSAIAGSFINTPTLYIYNALPTMAAAATGFLAALGCALLVGVLVFGVPVLRREMLALALVVNSIPLIALTPLLVVFFGSGHLTRSVIATISSFFPILIGLVQGLRRMDSNCEELLTLYAASRWNQFTMLAFPTALPFLFSGMKIGAPNAVLAAVIAEWAGASNGLGLVMVQSLFSFNVAQTWAAILSCCLLALAAYQLVAWLEGGVLRKYAPHMARSR